MFVVKWLFLRYHCFPHQFKQIFSVSIRLSNRQHPGISASTTLLITCCCLPLLRRAPTNPLLLADLYFCQVTGFSQTRSYAHILRSGAFGLLAHWHPLECMGRIVVKTIHSWSSQLARLDHTLGRPRIQQAVFFTLFVI